MGICVLLSFSNRLCGGSEQMIEDAFRVLLN